MEQVQYNKVSSEEIFYKALTQKYIRAQGKIVKMKLFM